MSCGPGNIQNGGGVCYPDATGVDWRLSGDERSRTRWFNTDAFVDRNPANGPFRYGTVARNSLIGPGIVSVDASANKRFQFRRVVRRVPGRGLQPPEPPDLEPAGIAAADAHFRRHQQHADGLASDPAGAEVRLLRVTPRVPDYGLVSLTISAAGTRVDGPWKIALNTSLNVARGCARKSTWLPIVTT